MNNVLVSMEMSYMEHQIRQKAVYFLQIYKKMSDKAPQRVEPEKSTQFTTTQTSGR